MAALQIESPKIHNYASDGLPSMLPHSKQNYIRVLQRLRELGVGWLGFRSSEVRYLPQLVQPEEQINGAVLGQSNRGHVMLAATDNRIIYLDTKPLFVRTEDISFDAVAGLTLEWVTLRGTLVLYTRLGEFRLKIINRKSAEIFRSYVEQKCLTNYRRRW